MSILQFIKDHFTQTDHSHLVSQDGQSILSNWEIGGHHVQVVFYVQNDEFLMIRVGDLYKFHRTRRFTERFLMKSTLATKTIDSRKRCAIQIMAKSLSLAKHGS